MAEQEEEVLWRWWEIVNHLNQEPLDFAAAVALLRLARNDADRFSKGWDSAYKQAMENGERAADALALLRELNDALAIPERFQARVDAVLDRAEEKT